MALGVEESKRKYHEYLDLAHDFKIEVEKEGYRVNIKDDIELGATYELFLGEKQLAVLWWNVPHYITFESTVDPKDNFSTDYIRDIAEWKYLLYEALRILETYGRMVRENGSVGPSSPDP